MNDFLALLSYPVFDIIIRAIFVMVVLSQFGGFLASSFKLLFKTKSIKALGKNTLKFVLVLVALILGFGLGLAGIIRLGIDIWNFILPLIFPIKDWIFGGGR